MRKNILAGFILLMSLSAGIEAHDLDQDCNPINPIAVPAECRRISDSIHLLETEKAHLQAELPQANSVVKGQLMRSIRALNRRLDSAKADLARCRREHGATPRVLAPSELRARFTGTASVRPTHSNYEVPDVTSTSFFDFRKTGAGSPFQELCGKPSADREPFIPFQAR